MKAKFTNIKNRILRARSTKPNDVSVLFLELHESTAIPYRKRLTLSKFKRRATGEPQLTDVHGKWYLEYDMGDYTIRVLDITDEIPSRELEPLKSHVEEYFGLTNLPERPILQSGVKVKVYASSNFREIIFYADYRILRRDVCYSEARHLYGLMRDETHDWFFITSINDVPPVFGRNNVPHHYIVMESHTRGRRD